MTALERHLHHVDVICADLKAALDDASDACKTPADWAVLDERLSVTAHWLANVRQGVICHQEILRRTTEPIDTTGGS